MTVPPHHRLLAVTHEASRTGAPLVLLEQLRWLREHTDVSIHSLLVADGPLRREFSKVGSVSAVEDLPGASMLGLAERWLSARNRRPGLQRLAATLRYRTALARLGRFDVVYLNSITTLALLPYLRGHIRVVAHIHEGPLTITQWWRANSAALACRRPDRWIAVSEETADALCNLPGNHPDTVVLHRPFIDVARFRRPVPGLASQRELRRRLGIPPDALIVVGSGSIERRKGPDLFVQLACEVRRLRPPADPPVHFLWVGGDLAGLEWPQLQAEIERSGADHVHVTGGVDDPRPYFHVGDVFALTSREDPYPLVCLEGAALGKPVVAYSSSGIRELLTSAGEASADGVVPYNDVRAMARHILLLLDTPDLAWRVGTQLRALVEYHNDASTVAPGVAEELGLGTAIVK